MIFNRWPTVLRSGLSVVGTMHRPGRTSRRRRTASPLRVDFLENRTLLDGSPSLIPIPSPATENSPGGFATLYSAPLPVGPETTPDGPGMSGGEDEVGTGVPALGQVPLSYNPNDATPNQGGASSSESGSGAGHASVADRGNTTGDEGGRDVQEAGPLDNTTGDEGRRDVQEAGPLNDLEFLDLSVQPGIGVSSWESGSGAGHASASDQGNTTGDPETALHLPVAIVDQLLDEVEVQRLPQQDRVTFFAGRVGEGLNAASAQGQGASFAERVGEELMGARGGGLLEGSWVEGLTYALGEAICLNQPRHIVEATLDTRVGELLGS
jgi:hypothetical protein